jgi:hypothetical protein
MADIKEPVRHIGAWSPTVANMALRDWFAGQALAGITANAWLCEKFGGDGVQSAAWAYQYADAMLAERERRNA